MATNRFLELRNSFRFLKCAAHQDSSRKKCAGNTGSHTFSRDLREVSDYVFCLFLVASIAQFEAEIDAITGVPDLGRAGKLQTKMKLLRDHFGIPEGLYDRMDMIRIARNRVVHQGEKSVDAGCTMMEVPGIMVTYLQACRHPDYL